MVILGREEFMGLVMVIIIIVLVSKLLLLLLFKGRGERFFGWFGFGHGWRKTDLGYCVMELFF